MTNNLNDDTIDIDLIEKYHRGLLEDAELEDFLKREKSDKDFALKVRSYTEIMDGIDYYVKQKGFADTIQEWEKEIKEHSKKKQSDSVTDPSVDSGKDTIALYKKNVFWMAAAVVGLLVVSGVFLLRSFTPDPAALYEAYYQPYPTVFDPTVRGDTDTVSLTKKAFRAYNEGDYARATEYFKEALVTDNKIEKDNALLYLANCYLAQNSAAAAKEILLQIGEQSHVASQAKWYLALTYLKLNDPDPARKVLKELTDHPNSYQNKATLLLQEIAE